LSNYKDTISLLYYIMVAVLCLLSFKSAGSKNLLLVVGILLHYHFISQNKIFGPIKLAITTTFYWSTCSKPCKVIYVCLKDIDFAFLVRFFYYWILQLFRQCGIFLFFMLF